MASLLIIPYIHSDPYMDYGKKQNYSWKYSFQQLGDISTKKLLNSSTKYNSFIFGSSRSTSLYACYLNEIFPDSRFFHYANWSETIGGICNKLDLIDSLGYRIDNVIIYIDTDATFQGKGKCNITDHYLVTKSGKFDYLKSHLVSFYLNMTFDKIKILFGCKISGAIFPNWNSDLTTNDPNHSCNDPDILLNYSKINDSQKLRDKIDSLRTRGFFYKRPLAQQYKEDQISESEKNILLKIKKLFTIHSTKYYIVITPLYDQLKFSCGDQEILTILFDNRLFDFSGINRYTNNEYNYLDERHFQPYISKCMIDSIIMHERSTRGI